MEIVRKTDFQENSENVVTKKQTIHPIDELITSEQDYLVLLHNIVNGYLREYRNSDNNISPPRNLKYNEGLLVFVNIEAIFVFHRDHFLKSLVLNRYNPSKLASVFIDNESKFQMYAEYGRSKTLSTYLVKKHSKYFEKLQNKLGFKSDLNQMLISPIRRLANYGVLLGEIIKHIKKAGLYDELPSLYEAENIIKSINASVDDYRVLEGILDIIPNYGKLLHHGFLNCDYKNSKGCLLYVFLCKKFVVFTHRQDDSTNPFETPSYKIFLEIPMNKIDLFELTENKFFLCCNSEPDLKYNIICSADDNESYQKWLEAIRRQLQLQDNFIRSLQNLSDDDDDDDDDTTSNRLKVKEVLI